MRAFNCQRYLDAQVAAFRDRLHETPEGGRTYIEFGGKAMDDRHAARVLPGYNPDLKLALLHELQGSCSIVVAVAARDLLKPRIRGDSQLFYDKETVALILKLGAKGISVDAGVVTMCGDNYTSEQADQLEAFFALARRETGLVFARHPRIQRYPHLRTAKDWGVWNKQERLNVRASNVLVFSPGGGSGKFGVCVSELYRDYRAGMNSWYLKFETFPVFDLPVSHPVNRAFVAATADLGNVVQTELGGGKTTYDKDEENFALLMRMHDIYCPAAPENPITNYQRPSDMGVNMLVAGFDDEPAIRRAAEREIARRAKRYLGEIARGIETPATLGHLNLYTGRNGRSRHASQTRGAGGYRRGG